MPRRLGAVAEAEHQAQRLLHRFGVRAASHIRVEAFAARLGVEIEHTTIDGAAAQLVRNGARAVILLNDRLDDPALRRFSIAHELGHFVLRHPSPALAVLSAVEPGQPARGVRRRHEAEANAFAAELLMPAQLLGQRCRNAALRWELAAELAAEFAVSPVASAIRIAELTEKGCAVVMSAERLVRWVVRSKAFGLDIRRGRAVVQGSCAWEWFAAGTDHAGPRPVEVAVWADAVRDAGHEMQHGLQEHAIASPARGTVMSLLSAL